MIRKKIISVVGARPNFMKVAPIDKSFKKYSNYIEHIICHTGQHYDKKMSKIFFDDLDMPKPKYFLGVGSGSHANQTANIMMKFEKVLLEENPEMVIVVGDVNSTLACSIVAKKMNIKTAHVEAGLRSFDREMPEEINRIVTDVISDYLFISEPSGLINLEKEGISKNKLFFVGNVMIDSLKNNLPLIDTSNIIDELNLTKNKYVLTTFHRPSNVDHRDTLTSLCNYLNKIAEKRKIVIPLHPRTKTKLEEFNLSQSFSKNIIITEPIGYIEFLKLVKNAELIVTDSGGIQEESTYLKVQCITVRNNTERPITVEHGTNHLIGTDFNKVLEATMKILNGYKKNGKIPEKWDGKASERIVKKIVELI